MNLNHIAIIASTEASIEFYERLGFEVTYRLKRKNDEIVFMTGNGVTLEMFIDPTHPAELIGRKH